MSAPPHYQSRLFNFLTDRALRWSDRAAQALRHAQIAAKTVARSVLLPIWAIAENLGISPPKLPGFAGAVRDRSLFAPGVEDEANRDRGHHHPTLDADAPIRATLTILDAVGWPTVDRLDRDALQPASDAASPTHWLDRFRRQPRSPQHPDLTAPPEPLAIQLSEQELRAIAPHGKPDHTSPIRGLASELGRNDLVLISANNEIVAHLGVLPQQTLDRTVRLVLHQLAPASLPPARSGLTALPTISQLVQPLLTRLDTGLARLEARSLPPSGFAIAQPFDLHQEFAETALETAITTPLDQLQTAPASNLKALEFSLTASLQALMRSLLSAAIPESPAPLHRPFVNPNFDLNTPLRALNAWAIALRPPASIPATDHDRTSRTTIDGSHWSIDPADPWWRNAIDLARAAIASTVSAIVPVQSSPPDSDSDTAHRLPDLADRLGYGDQPLRSKTVNRLRDWFGDRDDPLAATLNSDPPRDPVTAPIVPTAHDAHLTANHYASNTNTPNTNAPFTASAIAQPSSGSVATRSRPQHTASGLDFDPDWIEAEVHQSRYVIHPLERVLRWLDRAMVAIEGWIERAIEAISQWWSRRQAS